MTKNVKLTTNVLFGGKVECPAGAVISSAEAGNRTGSFAEPTDEAVTHVLQGDKFVAVESKSPAKKKKKSEKKEEKVEEVVEESATEE